MPTFILFVLLSVATAFAEETLKLSWTNNMLRIAGDRIPGGYVDTLYLEAFCRSGSTHQVWDKTTIPHKTELLSASPSRLVLRSRVEPQIVVDHEIIARADEVEFRLELRNTGSKFADVQWFQPCMRVDRFAGANQKNYVEKSFIYVGGKLKRLDQLPRNEEAIYHGGQVYVPAGIPLEDVNPRPISSLKPSNALIGCFSKDEKQILATAWSDTQELFQGVIVCLHNDPRIGGLKPGEAKKLLGKVYILPNDPAALEKRYQADFGR